VYTFFWATLYMANFLLVGAHYIIVGELFMSV